MNWLLSHVYNKRRGQLVVFKPDHLAALFNQMKTLTSQLSDKKGNMIYNLDYVYVYLTISHILK